MKKTLFAVSMGTLAVLYGLLAAVAAVVCIVCGASALYVLVTVVIVAGIQFLLGPWLTDLNMRWFYKTKFNQPVPEFIETFVAAECEKNGIKKMPRIGIIEDGSPNAFTYGHTKNDARIVVTRGLIDMLDEDECRAVVAHELGHAVHYDMIVMTAAQLIPMVLYYLYDIMRQVVRSSSGKSSKNSDSGNAKSAALVIAAVIYVLYVISEYIVLWLSRTREYYADDFAARETGKPNSLASALVQIGFGLSTGSDRREARQSAAAPSALGIADGKAGKGMALVSMDGDAPDKANIKKAMRWDMWNVWAKLYELQSTHPLISKRILAISKISPEFGQAPYIIFDEQKPESYADDFAREVILAASPWIALIAGIVIWCCTAGGNGSLLPVALGMTVSMILSIIKHRYSHPRIDENAEPTTVENLLEEVKVSRITAIPCKLEGQVIGRGDPGCVFSEDFVLRDNTGIIFLNYSKPLGIQDKIFALFRAKDYLNEKVTVTGWYRRAPQPYIDMKYMTRGDAKKRCDGTVFGYVIRFIALAAGVILTLASLAV